MTPVLSFGTVMIPTGLSISVTHVLALVTSVLALACWHLLQCIFDLLPLNIYSWGHHPLKCFFKALANALETVAALMGDEANAFFWIKEMHLATLRPTQDSKQNRRGECIFSASQIVFCNSLVLLNSCLNYYWSCCCLSNSLRPRCSPLPLAWGHGASVQGGGTSCSKSRFDPMPEAGGERCGLRQFLKQQQFKQLFRSTSGRRRFVNRKKCIRRCGSVLGPR